VPLRTAAAAFFLVAVLAAREKEKDWSGRLTETPWNEEWLEGSGERREWTVGWDAVSVAWAAMATAIVFLTIWDEIIIKRNSVDNV
jgi:hypothetical protein